MQIFIKPRDDYGKASYRLPQINKNAPVLVPVNYTIFDLSYLFMQLFKHSPSITLLLKKLYENIIPNFF